MKCTFNIIMSCVMLSTIGNELVMYIHASYIYIRIIPIAVLFDSLHVIIHICIHSSLCTYLEMHDYKKFLYYIVQNHWFETLLL